MITEYLQRKREQKLESILVEHDSAVSNLLSEVREIRQKRECEDWRKAFLEERAAENYEERKARLARDLHKLSRKLPQAIPYAKLLSREEFLDEDRDALQRTPQLHGRFTEKPYVDKNNIAYPDLVLRVAEATGESDLFIPLFYEFFHDRLLEETYYSPQDRDLESRRASALRKIVSVADEEKAKSFLERVSCSGLHENDLTRWDLALSTTSWILESHPNLLSYAMERLHSTIEKLDLVSETNSPKNKVLKPFLEGKDRSSKERIAEELHKLRLDARLKYRAGDCNPNFFEHVRQTGLSKLPLLSLVYSQLYDEQELLGIARNEADEEKRFTALYTLLQDRTSVQQDLAELTDRSLGCGSVPTGFRKDLVKVVMGKGYTPDVLLRIMQGKNEDLHLREYIVEGFAQLMRDEKLSEPRKSEVGDCLADIVVDKEESQELRQHVISSFYKRRGHTGMRIPTERNLVTEFVETYAKGEALRTFEFLVEHSNHPLYLLHCVLPGNREISRLFFSDEKDEPVQRLVDEQRFIEDKFRRKHQVAVSEAKGYVDLIQRVADYSTGKRLRLAGRHGCGDLTMSPRDDAIAGFEQMKRRYDQDASVYMRDLADVKERIQDVEKEADKAAIASLELAPLTLDKFKENGWVSGDGSCERGC